MTKQHILGLDVLRGFCALSVAAYHILSWNECVDFTAVGRYGVYIFFVLSGFSIHYQYSNRVNNLNDIKTFLKKRFFRLFPLLVLITIFSQYTAFLNMDLVRASSIFLTLSLLFGFSAPAVTSAVTGGWSLGVEFSFYMLYPIMLAYCQNIRQYIVLMFVLFALKYLFTEYAFSKYYIDHSNLLFTSPLSFAFYFVTGCFLAEFYPFFKNTLKKTYLLFLSIPLFLLFFLPIGMSAKDVLTGYTGSFFTLLSCVSVLIYSLYIPEHAVTKKISKFLGEISYGVYLLHPLLYFHLFKKYRIISDLPVIQCFVILTITSIFAIIIKRLYEDPVISFFKAPSSYRVKLWIDKAVAKIS